MKSAQITQMLKQRLLKYKGKYETHEPNMCDNLEKVWHLDFQGIFIVVMGIDIYDNFFYFPIKISGTFARWR